MVLLFEGVHDMVAKSGSEANAQGVPAWMPVDFLKLGKERTDAMLAMQKEFLDTYEQAGQAWLSRVKSEADLWSELAAKLTGTHSVPEALSAYQQTMVQRMKMASEDGKRLSDEAQRLMKTITTSLSNGSPAARS
jgi:hypothetical protein